MLPDQAGERVDELVVLPRVQPGLQPLLLDRHPQLVQVAAEPGPLPAVGGTGQRRTAPQPQRLVQQADPLAAGHRAAAALDQDAEPVQVDHLRVGLQRVPGAAGTDAHAEWPCPGQCGAQVRDHRRDATARPRRRLPPQQVDQAFGRHEPARFQGEDRQQEPFLAPDQADRPAADGHLNRSEDPKVHDRHRRRRTRHPQAPTGRPAGAARCY